MHKLILASSSPRRRKLLSDMGFDFDIIVPNVDERKKLGEEPFEYVRRIALLKSKAVQLSNLDRIIISADTIVVLKNEIYGKPKDKQDFIRIMKVLSGKTHYVYTSYSILYKDLTISKLVVTEVDYSVLNDKQIEWYWNTKEPKDKAGGYAIQGIGGMFIKSIKGSYSNIVGFPQAEIYADLMSVIGDCNE